MSQAYNSTMESEICRQLFYDSIIYVFYDVEITDNSQVVRIHDEMPSASNINEIKKAGNMFTISASSKIISVEY